MLALKVLKFCDEGGNLIFEVLGILNMTFLDNLQVLLKCLEGFQKQLVAISQRFVLIDEGIGFFLEGFKGGRLSIMDRGRGVGGNSVDRRRGVFLDPSVIR